MIPEIRRAFNAAWTPGAYDAFMTKLQQRTGGKIGFPLSETPCFFPRPLIQRMADEGAELVRQALTGKAAEAAEAVVPDRFRGAAATEPHPTFIQVDFGITQNEHGDFVPRLVELQAFASLYGFQIALADAYQESFPTVAKMEPYLGGFTDATFREIAGKAIVGGHDPAEVVLMEIKPKKQKTWPDFSMTEQLWGVRAIDLNDVVKDGSRLLYKRAGQLTPIRRIYNRVIPDELERKGLTTPFDYREDLDVEWAGHPEWFFRLSKFSIPWLRHDVVPRTWFLHEVTELPMPREQLLLKPLFSFAGGGIVFAPTDEQLAAIPANRRDQFILQEKIAFTPIIDTPHGMTQAEVRIMYVWTDELVPLLPLVRMGRGKMMGVDHNKGLKWVGASAGFIVG